VLEPLSSGCWILQCAPNLATLLREGRKKEHKERKPHVDLCLVHKAEEKAESRKNKTEEKAEEALITHHTTAWRTRIPNQILWFDD